MTFQIFIIESLLPRYAILLKAWVLQTIMGGRKVTAATTSQRMESPSQRMCLSFDNWEAKRMQLILSPVYTSPVCKILSSLGETPFSWDWGSTYSWASSDNHSPASCSVGVFHEYWWQLKTSSSGEQLWESRGGWQHFTGVWRDVWVPLRCQSHESQ